jgi:hypothetical protein
VARSRENGEREACIVGEKTTLRVWFPEPVRTSSSGEYGTMFSFYAYDGIFRIMGCTDMLSSLVRLRGREETAALGMAGAVAGVMRSWSRI